MTFPLKITEKIISLLLILWGCFSLYFLSKEYYLIFSYGFESGKLSWQEISLFKIFKNFHLIFILPCLTVFAGIFLALNKKIGWVTALIVLLLNALLIFIPSNKSWSIIEKRDFDTIAILIVTELLFFGLFYTLLLKPFRLKYAPVNSAVKVVILTTVLVLLDKIIVTFTS
jgi:hypothetical protein